MVSVSGEAASGTAGTLGGRCVEGTMTRRRLVWLRGRPGPCDRLCELGSTPGKHQNDPLAIYHLVELASRSLSGKQRNETIAALPRDTRIEHHLDLALLQQICPTLVSVSR